MLRLPILILALGAASPALAANGWQNPPPGDAASAPSPTPAAATPPAAPQPAPPPASPTASSERQQTGLRERAARFIGFYWDVAGDSAPAALAYLRTTYAPVVDYYGKPTRRAAILGDKQRYLHRWPDRATWPAVAGTGPQISCTDSSDECEISGERAFANANPATRARAAGRFSFDYRVRFRGGAAQIVAEKSTVLARRWE